MQWNQSYSVAAMLWLVLLVVVFGTIVSASLSTTVIALTVFTALITHWWGPVVFLATYVVRPLLLLPISIFSVISGAMFGLWPGLLITMLGTLISAVVAHQVGWYFSGILPASTPRLQQKVRDVFPFEFVASLHLSLLPFDVVNYGVGLARIPFIPFFIGVFFGMIPGTFSLTILGASIDVPTIIENGVTNDAINWTYFSFALIGIMLIWSGSFVFRRLRKARPLY